MAKRPIFLPNSEGVRLVDEVFIEFNWSPGFAPVQKKKNIDALHDAAALKGYAPLLEVSTKSKDKLGERLSSFNLMIELQGGRKTSLECAYQGSKVFERGGPFQDLYLTTSREAKRDHRLRESGGIVGFSFDGVEFPSEPKTAFYDWLYVRALAPHEDYLSRLKIYAGFTDIEFNPELSINCQARSCALFVALSLKSLVSSSIQSPRAFISSTNLESLSGPLSYAERQSKLL